MAAAYSACEGGRDRDDEGDREGRRADGRARQLHRAGRDRDADPRGAVARSTSTTWSSASRWVGWARRTRSRRWRAGSRARSARSRPARRTTSPAAGRSTDAPRRSLGRSRRRVSVGARSTARATSASCPGSTTRCRPARRDVLARGQPASTLDRPVQPRARSRAHAHLAARPARGVVRRCHVRAQPRRAHRGERASRTSTTLVYDARPARAVPQGRRLPPHRRARRADRDPRRLDLERAGAGDRARARRARARSSAYTIGNDVSSRDIEGANPLYLTQAKVFAGACAIGPALYVPPRRAARLPDQHADPDEDGEVLYEDKTSTTQHGAHVRGARLVARARQPRPAGIACSSPARGSSRRSLQPRPRQLGRDPRAGDRHAVNPVALATNLVRKEPSR